MEDPPVEHTASIIGIVTAISGNVVISIALNLQRYAHLRLKKVDDDNGHGDVVINEHREGEIESEEAENETGFDSDFLDSANAHDELCGGLSEEVSEPLSESVPDVEIQDRGDSDMQEPNGHRFDNEQNSGSGLLPALNISQAPLRSTRSSISIVAKTRTRQSNTTTSVADSVSTKLSDRFHVPRYMKNGYWWLGILLMVAGEAGNFIAYGFAPASTVSPLGVVALISNCIIAPIFFHEQFRLRDLFGVLIAIAGAVVVVLASNSQEDQLDPRRILAAVRQPGFLIYAGVTGLLIIVLSGSSTKYGNRFIFINIFLVALFGGYTALATKALSSLVTYTLYRIFTFWITYVLIAILAVTAVLQVKYLSRALQQFGSTEVIPTHFVFFTLSVVVGSSILYQDFDGETEDQVTRFVVGCLLTFIGVYLITSKRASKGDSAVSSEEDVLSPVRTSASRDYGSGIQTPSLYRPNLGTPDVDPAVNRQIRLTTLTSTTTATPLQRLTINTSFDGTETTALLTQLENQRTMSPGTTNRGYVPGAGSMGLLVESYVRDQANLWQTSSKKSNSGSRRRKALVSVEDSDTPLQPVKSTDSGESGIQNGL
ncbi:magnesium transporter NIPA-domain-containing protein [Lipomyces oligophaga]|uniref:magnesium transporter NIPA-domain-containing protein n=1 Tax=Lipomyces oligophaga TaxID=45792 RepID=UPI0034CF219F